MAASCCSELSDRSEPNQVARMCSARTGGHSSRPNPSGWVGSRYRSHGPGRDGPLGIDAVGQGGSCCLHVRDGEVGGAIDKVIHDWPKVARRPARAGDPGRHARSSPESVALDAAYYLVDHGYGSTTFTITTNDIHCTQCGELAVHSSPADSRCDRCGALLPQVPRARRRLSGGRPMCLMMPGRSSRSMARACQVETAGQIDKASKMLEPDLQGRRLGAGQLRHRRARARRGSGRGDGPGVRRAHGTSGGTGHGRAAD